MNSISLTISGKIRERFPQIVVATLQAHTNTKGDSCFRKGNMRRVHILEGCHKLLRKDRPYSLFWAARDGTMSYVDLSCFRTVAKFGKHSCIFSILFQSDSVKERLKKQENHFH